MKQTPTLVLKPCRRFSFGNVQHLTRFQLRKEIKKKLKRRLFLMRINDYPKGVAADNSRREKTCLKFQSVNGRQKHSRIVDERKQQKKIFQAVRKVEMDF